MPPLPITFKDDSLELILSLQRRQKDLSEFQIPRLRACVGPLSLQQDLASELREDVDTFARQLEALDVLVEDQNGERNRRELRRTVEEFRETLVSLRKASRMALLDSKRAIDSKSHTLREELLNSSAFKEKQNLNEKASDDALMKANADVTDALRRTIDLMQGELERSVLTSQMLDASTSTLRSSSDMHDTLNSVMNTSKQLITALEKSDWLDRLLILTGMSFFLLVVLFILKQRILDRGLRIAFWWTRFLPDFSGDAELAAMEKAGEPSTVVATSSVVVSTIPTLSSLILSSAIALSDHQIPHEPVESSILDEAIVPVHSPTTSYPSSTPVSTDLHDEL